MNDLKFPVVDDRYFKMPYFLTKQRSFAFVATMGYVITLELELLKKKVVWVNNHTELGALAFEGTVLDNISIVFEKESFTA